MAVATQIIGAALGVGAAFAIIIGPELMPVEPIIIECTDAQVMETPDSNLLTINVTRLGGDEIPVILTIPEIPPL